MSMSCPCPACRCLATHLPYEKMDELVDVANRYGPIYQKYKMFTLGLTSPCPQLLMQRSASDALPSASSFAPTPPATALSHHTAAPAPSPRPVAPDSPRHPAAVSSTSAATAAAAAAAASCATAAPPPPPLLVPCAVDTLLAAAVHHSRAAAGEELLGNAAGAVQEYDRAADLLAFLMAAAPPGPVGGGGGAVETETNLAIGPSVSQRVSGRGVSRVAGQFGWRCGVGNGGPLCSWYL